MSQLDQLNSAERAIEQGINLLRKTLDNTTSRSLMVLCDPMLANPLDEHAQQLELPVHRLRFSYRDLGDEHKPFLLLIKDEIALERFVNLSIRIAVTEARAARSQAPSPRSVCAWVVAPEEEAQTLCAALSALALQTPPHQPDQKRLFRFWDPRVFDHLHRIWGASALNARLNHASHWLWVDSSGSMCCFPLTPSKSTAIVPLTPTEWSAMERIEDLNQALRLTNSLESTDFQPVASALDQALTHAHTLRLTQSLDRITYAVLWHSLGGRFEGHAAVRQCFDAAAQGESLSDQLALLEQATWDKLRTDMKSQHTPTRSATGVTP